MGVTPSENSPTGIVNAMQTYSEMQWENAVNYVIAHPNSYGLYTQSQYDQNYNNGYNAGYSAGQGAAQNVRCIQFNTWSNGSNEWLVSRMSLDCSRASRINFGSVSTSHGDRNSITVSTNVGTLFGNASINSFGGNRSFDVSNASSVNIEIIRRYSEDTIAINEISLN